MDVFHVLQRDTIQVLPCLFAGEKGHAKGRNPMLLIIPGHGIAGAGTALAAGKGDHRLFPLSGVVIVALKALVRDSQHLVRVCSAGLCFYDADDEGEDCKDDQNPAPAAELIFSLFSFISIPPEIPYRISIPIPAAINPTAGQKRTGHRIRCSGRPSFISSFFGS